MAACLLLTTPKIFKLLDIGVSEPAAVFCLAAVVFCARRERKGLPWMMGLTLVSKQYMLLAAAAAPLLRRSAIAPAIQFRDVLKSAAIMLLFTAPMALWHPVAFWFSAVQRHLHQAFRPDSLSFASAWVHGGHAPPPAWLPIPAALIAAAVALATRRPQSSDASRAADFAAATAGIFLVSFSLAGAATLNYYFLILAALCCALAADGSET